MHTQEMYPDMKELQQNSSIVCAIDIGTSKVAALVARRNQYGKIEILGVGKLPVIWRRTRRSGQYHAHSRCH